MFEQTKKAVAKLGNFSDQELDLFTGKLKQKALQRKEFLLQKGEVCKTLYYFKAGSLRQYHKTNDDNEDTLNLFVENDWVLDYQSFISQKPPKIISGLLKTASYWDWISIPFMILSIKTLPFSQ